jgi:NADH-quinone oxidoreductase subunit N
MSGLQGLLHKHKLAGITMIVCLLSFTGIPPLAGFWGKFGILSLSMQSHLIPLVLVAILSSLIGAYNYVRIVTSIATPDEQNATKLTFHPFFIGWLALGTLLLIAMGCFPEAFIDLF